MSLDSLIPWLIVLPMAGLLIYTLYRSDIVTSHDRRLKLLLSYFRRHWPEAIELYSAIRTLRDPGEISKTLNQKNFN